MLHTTTPQARHAAAAAAAAAAVVAVATPSLTLYFPDGSWCAFMLSCYTYSLPLYCVCFSLFFERKKPLSLSLSLARFSQTYTASSDTHT